MAKNKLSENLLFSFDAVQVTKTVSTKKKAVQKDYIEFQESPVDISKLGINADWENFQDYIANKRGNNI